MKGLKILNWLFNIASGCLLVLATAAQSQALRDPTVPPMQASGASGTHGESSLAQEGISVIVRDGKAGLVQGTRVIFPGQKWDGWTLERITETEVWMRDGKTLRKMPRFNGITRTPTAVRVPACAPRNAAFNPAGLGQRTTAPPPPTSIPADTPCDALSIKSSHP